MIFQWERGQKVLAGRQRAVGKDFAVPAGAWGVSLCERVKRKLATVSNGRVLDKGKPAAEDTRDVNNYSAGPDARPHEPRLPLPVGELVPPVPVPRARSRIAETPSGLEVAIPMKKNWFLVLFSGFWMIGWAVGEVFAIRELVGGESPSSARLFLVAWLGAWTVGGGFIGYSWLWIVFGLERISLRPSVLVIKRDLFGTGRNREFDLNYVKNLRVAPPTFNPLDFSSALQFWGVGGGQIAFDYGAKTYRFAAGVDDAEARGLVERFTSRHAFE